MATSGSVVYSGEVIQNQRITALGYSILLTKKSGSFPTSNYSISKVSLQRTFASTSSYNFFVCVGSKNTGTRLTQSLDAQRGGVAYSSSISNSFFSVIKSTFVGESQQVCLVGDNSQQSGILRSGTFVQFTITWTQSDKATNFTLSSSSVNIGSSIDLSGTGESADYTYTLYTTVNNSGFSDNVTKSEKNISASIDFNAATVPPIIPNAESAQAKITLTTKNNGSTVGSVSKTVTVNVPNTSTYKPLITDFGAVAQKPVVIDNVSHILQNWSYATISFKVRPGKGATLKKVSIYGTNIDTNIYSFSNPDADGYYSIEKNTKTFGSAGSNFSYTVTATDSRQRSISYTGGNITVEPYEKPSCQNLTVSRCTNEGDVVATGEYGVLQATVSYSPLLYNGVPQNTLKMKVEMKEAGEGYPTSPIYNNDFENPWIITHNGSLENLSKDGRYTFRFTFYDTLVTLSPIEIDLPTAYVLMRWEPQNSAFGYGCYPAGKKRVEIADDWGLYQGTTEVFGELDTLNNNVTTLNGNITTINGNITTINGNVSTLRTDVDTLNDHPTLWSSSSVWRSGNQTSKEDLNEWEVLECQIGSAAATGTLIRRDNKFIGMCFGPSWSGDTGFGAYCIEISYENKTTMTLVTFNQLRINTAGISDISGSGYGIKSLKGLIRS